MSQALGRLPEILEVVSRGMETGVFFARASGRLRPEGHCRWCDYLSICGKDRVRRQALKSSDPEVSGFERLAEIDGAPAEDEE
jgi:hypothetical protein